MRNILNRALLALLSLSLLFGSTAPVIAQSTGPGNAAFAALSKLSIVPQPTIEERCAREGEQFSAYGSGAAVSVAAGTGNTTVASTGAITGVGKVAYVSAVSATLTAGAIAQISIASDVNSRFPGWVTQFATPTAGGGSGLLLVNQFFRAFQVQTGVVALAVRNNYNGSTTAYTSGLYVGGCAFTDDLNWNAAKVMVGSGDSTWNGTGPTLTKNMLPFLAKDYFRSQGVDVGLILRSRSGSTSVDHELWRSSGWYDVGVPVGLWLYNLGLNNAGNSMDPNLYLANITSFWTWFHALYPKSQAVILGVAPAENNTTEANAAVLRTTAATYVASVNSPLLKYCNLGTAFDRTNTSFYASTDATGSHIHASDAGHAAEWVLLKACIDAQGIKVLGGGTDLPAWWKDGRINPVYAAQREMAG